MKHNILNHKVVLDQDKKLFKKKKLKELVKIHKFYNKQLKEEW